MDLSGVSRVRFKRASGTLMLDVSLPSVPDAKEKTMECGGEVISEYARASASHRYRLKYLAVGYGQVGGDRITGFSW